MQQVVTVQRYCGVTESGDPGYATEKLEFCARVEFKRSVVVNAQGENVVSDNVIYTGDEIGYRDRIWLPGKSVSDVRQSRWAKEVRMHPDENGDPHHYEVFV